MIRYFAAHPTAANLLLILIVVAGLVSLPQLRRETFPDFAADRVQIRVVYPGAGAEAVEEAICQRIEDAVDGITNLDEIRCEAREGIGTATIDMMAGGDIDRFLTDVTSEIGGIDTFPDSIERPLIRRLDRIDRVVSIAITGPMTEPDLRVFAEDVRDRLRRVPGVTQVAIQGFSQRQIRIALNAEALRRYGLSVADIAGLVERQSLDLPSGTIETTERDVLVRFADERRSVQEFEDMVVRGGSSGAVLRLGQIAAITDRFEFDEERVLYNGRRAAVLQVNKTSDEDSLRVMAAVRAFVESERRIAPPGVEFALTRDVATIVEDRLALLETNGLQGFVLVFLALWLFLSLRASVWVSLGLPAAFLGTLAVMVALDFSINMMSMVGLLIAIGLVMDDSIVIAENIASHLARGKSAIQAAIDGTGEVGVGVLSSFATSVCVFAPLAFLEGDIGKVMRVVPVVLILTLCFSLIEAFLILPHHLAASLGRERPTRLRRWIDAGFAGFRDRGLGRAVDAAVAWRYLTLGVVIAAFLVSLAMLMGGVLKFRAFPDLDGNVIEARILLPQGTPLARTEAVVAEVTAALGRVDAALSPNQPGGERLVRNVLVQYNLNTDASESGPHLATVTADLLTAERRSGRLDEVINLWREETGPILDTVSVAFKELQIGPAGQAIDIRLQGADLAALNTAARELEAWLGTYRGVSDLQHDLRPGKPELRFRLRDGALALGLDAATIAGQLRAAFQGRTAVDLQVGRDDFEVDVRLGAADQGSLGALDDFVVVLPGGAQVPLSAVAEIEPGRGYARINRIDGRRTVTLRGDVDTAIANTAEILADTRARFLPGLAERHPGITTSLEGEAAASAETGASMRRGFIIGLLGVFLLLSFQFRSYIEPVIVMLAIPMALIGVIWGHLAMGLELSMPSMLGFAALAGVVVNNSILLVLFVKQHAATGMAVVDAARQASRDRLRPALLTSLTTIAGMAPLLFETNLQAQVLIPLVTSLSFGLLASTVLVLLVLPALYAILHDFGLTTVARDRRPAAAEPGPVAAEAKGAG